MKISHYIPTTVPHPSGNVTIFTNLYNSENVWMSKEGGGAGNNWAKGYHKGTAIELLKNNLHLHGSM